MKKYIFLLALLLSAPAFAATNGIVSNAFDGTTVAGTGTTVVSRSFDFKGVKDMGYWLKLSPSASAGYTGSNVSIQMMTSYNDDIDNFATVTTLSYATNNVATVGTITFPNMRFVKFRVTGLTRQATDSTIKMYVFTQD